MEQSPPSRYTGEGFLLESISRRRAAAERIREEPPATQPSRINRIALWLALATVFSTFLAGMSAWSPLQLLTTSWTLGSLMPIRQAILANWLEGIQFSLALMAILVAHELGHYILTIVYRVPSTPPLFIPFPFISPIGTMGAVIAMHSGTANRKQIFDIGLAGPIAGLVIAIPVLAYGILDSSTVRFVPDESLVIGQPLLVQWLATWLVPDDAGNYVRMTNAQLSPFLMAGWVGLFVTGLNMMPLGQLDGGHVTFGLLGPKSYTIAVAAMIAAVTYVVYSGVFVFTLMLVLVFLMGLRHPPSSDDSKSLGLARQIVGWASLSLPLLCIPANPLTVLQ